MEIRDPGSTTVNRLPQTNRTTTICSCSLLTASALLVLLQNIDQHMLPTMAITFSQLFPPKPTLTEANLPSQKGKVFIVTGGASGVGFELCAILYQAGGKVYLVGRSEAKAQFAISKIKALFPTSPGELVFLSVHLDDLTTIEPAVEAFTAKESKLNVLFNNAGVSLCRNART